jgi:hypothetical protein
VKKKLQIAAGISLGVFLVWFVFRGTDWGKVYQAVRGAGWGWLALCEILCLLSFVTRVQRWGYIVRTAKPVSFRHMFSATQIGFMANFVLPGRVGEVIRALVLSRLTWLPFSRCFAFVVLDRVTDLFGLMAVLLVSVAAFHPQSAIILPAEIYASPIPAGVIRTAAEMTGLAIVLLVGFFVLLYLNQRLVLRISNACLRVISPRLAAKTGEMLQHFADGLHVFRSAGDMAKSIGFSLVTWSTFILVYAALFEAFDLDWPWYAPFVCNSLLAVVISLPGAPGFVGQFHIAIVGGLLIVMPNVDLDVAKAVAIVAHIINLVPVVLVGVYCLYREKFGLLELQHQSETVQESTP